MYDTTAIRTQPSTFAVQHLDYYTADNILVLIFLLVIGGLIVHDTTHYQGMLETTVRCPKKEEKLCDMDIEDISMPSTVQEGIPFNITVSLRVNFITDTETSDDHNIVYFLKHVKLFLER